MLESVLIIGFIVAISLWKSKAKKEDSAAFSKPSIRLGKILVFGGFVLSLLPLIVAVIGLPFNPGMFSQGLDPYILPLFYTFPVGIIISTGGARHVRKAVAADELKVPNERKDPRAKRNNVVLAAALLNLCTGVLLVSGQIFESPQNALHRQSGGNTSILFLMWPLGIIMLITGLVMTITALIVKRIPRPTESFIYAPGTFPLIFSLFIVCVTIVGIRTVAGLA
jgi:hypothetical protein